MAVIKCKMCGGDLNIVEDESVCECEYCGTRQTIPSADNEKKLTLFARANRLRLASEFDKAFGIYESIVADFPEEAEAYWGLVLCKYGIEYVDDPATGKKIPTCHRSSFDSVMEDSDFEQACENADSTARRVYREEAKQIEEIRKGILEVSGREEPYDIFICYKETNENGDRTLDSVLAQDIYDTLTDKGYRVFFARITLEDKLGQEYESYIFAALNSAKIMLAVGTDYEYYNAVWVKNEWSRYLKLMAKDKDKHLIPCYKNLDAYDMPKEFTKLQAQDLGKVGAMQDLLRGIEKLLTGIGVQEIKQEKTMIVKTETPGVESLLKRAQMFLEDEEWTSAEEYYNRILDIDPECAEAYLGQVLLLSHARNLQEFISYRVKLSKEHISEPELLTVDMDMEHILAVEKKFTVPADYLTEEKIERMYSFIEKYPSQVSCYKQQITEEKKFWNEYKNLVRAQNFSTAELKNKLLATRDEILQKLEIELQKAERKAAEAKQCAEQEYQKRLTLTDQKLHEEYDKQVQFRESEYQNCKLRINQGIDIWGYAEVLNQLERLKGYKDSEKLLEQCLADKKRQHEEENQRRSQIYQMSDRRNKGLCQHCGGTFKGLLKKVCTQCGKPKDY